MRKSRRAISSKKKALLRQGSFTSAGAETLVIYCSYRHFIENATSFHLSIFLSRVSCLLSPFHLKSRGTLLKRSAPVTQLLRGPHKKILLLTLHINM